MSFAIATTQKVNNKNPTIEILSEVSEEEYQRFMSSFNILVEYGQMRDLYEICVDTYSELRNFLSSSNIEQMLTRRSIAPRKIAQIANRLLVNYCSAMYLFVSKTPTYLKKYTGEGVVEEQFVQLTRRMYDDRADRSYCFFSKMRNYIIHNKLPFTKITGDVSNGYRLVMSKSDLLKDDNWGPAKMIIEEAGEEVDIIPLLERCSVQIAVLYYRALYCLATYLPIIDESVRLFREKHSVTIFDFVSYESIDDLKKGHCVLRPVPWDSIRQMIADMNKVPGITISNSDG